MSVDLMHEYLNNICDLYSTPIKSIKGREAVEYLWPINDIFKPKMLHIRKFKYNIKFEKEADSALKKLLDMPVENIFKDIKAGTWRVLLERYLQYIIVCMANESHNKPFITLPSVLNSEQIKVALLLFGLHEMKLPHKPAERSNYLLPENVVGLDSWRNL